MKDTFLIDISVFSKGEATGTERVLNSHTQAPISKNYDYSEV
jgi:hypothetical protein